MSVGDSGLISVKSQAKIEDANDHRLQRLLGKKYGKDQIFHPEPTVQPPLGFTWEIDM